MLFNSDVYAKYFTMLRARIRSDPELYVRHNPDPGGQGTPLKSMYNIFTAT
jgi:hypothetical protein